ncbi:hypothetical protein [Salidesulfovibrio onnuriiensis]|uniref:hypothetical protein n=1 Tax=Salidesulfovibrio onnuriiensis TaxID=2583823 RepID=UPI0011CA854D|nr:hypothetical protein [Salidesulfovibrio onnuriiensis]
MKINLPAPKGKTVMERTLRTLGMLLVFLVVIWAFYKNNENVLERVQKNRSVWDETGQLDKDEISYLRDFVKSMRERFGVAVKIQVFKGDVEMPELDSKTIYIGLSPAGRQVAVEFPPLLRPALGADFIESVNNEFFAEAFDTGQWGRELQILTTMIWSRLAALEESTQ